jgi:hypothetical protein
MGKRYLEYSVMSTDFSMFPTMGDEERMPG